MIEHPGNTPILHRVQATLVPLTDSRPPYLLSLRLCTGPKLCTHMNPQTQTIFILETFAALIGKLRTRVSFSRSIEADRL
jgi:hypothetical protein